MGRPEKRPDTFLANAKQDPADDVSALSLPALSTGGREELEPSSLGIGAPVAARSSEEIELDAVLADMRT